MTNEASSNAIIGNTLRIIASGEYHPGAELTQKMASYIIELEQKLTDMSVQLANDKSKCRELAEEISRRDEIFVPVYPDENTMNRMTDVFHDTAKIHCDEDSIFVDNAELVITAIINHYIKSDDAFLAEVRAQGMEMAACALDDVNQFNYANMLDDLVQKLRQEAAQ